MGKGRRAGRSGLILAIWLVGVMVFAAACGKTSGDSGSGGGSADANASGSSAVKVEKTGDKKLTIGFSNYAEVIPFYQSAIAGVKDKAKEFGWNVVTTDSKFDPAKQVTDVESLITRKVDVIIISPGDADALLPAYQAAAKAKIPMISLANRLAPSNKAWETAFYGVPNAKLGEVATEELVKAIGGKGEILRIEGPPGIAFVRESVKGASGVLGKNPGVKSVFQQNAKMLSAEEGFRIAQDGLTAHPKVNGIWAQDDELAVGAVRALQKRGLAGKVPVAWLGGTVQAMDLAAKHQLVGIVIGSYTWATDAMDGIHAAAVNGKEMPFDNESLSFPLKGADQAKELIAKCPETPNQLWCLGRK